MDAVDLAIEHTRSAIEKARRLKRALFQRVLSYGMKWDVLRSSSIGRIPARWGCARLGTFIADGPTNGLYRPDSDYGQDGTPIVRIDSFDEGIVHGLKTLRRVRLSEPEIARYSLSEGDVLINRVNSLSHIGKSAIVPALTETTVFESNMMRLRLKPELRSVFLILILCSDVARRHWLARAKPAVNQASINQRDVRELWIPVPDPAEQKEIVEIASAQDHQRESFERLLSGYETLKRGLLQDLLTGKVRVKPNAA
jgi:type I restriction enzyme S subunit